MLSTMQSSGAAQDLAAIAPANAKVEFENEHLRVLRVKIDGHKKLPMHEHRLSYFVTYLTDIHLMHYLPDGTREEVRARRGDVRWVKPVKHSDENLSDQPIECLIVEIKSPRS